MVYHRISDDMKQRALQLLSDGWDIIEVVDVLGVSAKSVGRWQVNYETKGHVSNRYSVRGRRRKLSTAIMLEIEELLKEDPSLYLDKICEWLAVFHDVPISLGGLCMNLKDFGLDRKVMRKVASQRNEPLRTQWMDYVLQTFTAEQMVFLDESSKDGRTLARKFGRARTGVTPEMSVDHNRGDRWSILPALTIDGYIALRVVEDSVDSMELYDFVLNDLLPKMNPWPAPCSVLILDNCNTHKSEALRLAVEASGCLLVFLPPYSPDFNPIEESFSCVKAYLRRNWHEFEAAEFPDIVLFTRFC